ncbi:Retrovirus-related Pol polyprotein from transposon opus [Gossypium australe]|uniref:Retrovirus-related Pol polyprotein from transposon opus n=1 Tax=Gossypium australe TaxID=47621 RepID=A0A5B6WER2_9ROSI|nr:Retrovirus-related Pol polyprotein from transposon opus [Gossypium australe]
MKSFDRCQRTGNISRRNTMPLMKILEVELFDVWGVDFSVVVDYISKQVEAEAYLTNNAKVVMRF